MYTCLFVSIYNLCVQSRTHRDLKRVWFSDDKVTVLVAPLDRGTGDQTVVLVNSKSVFETEQSFQNPILNIKHI